jgi:sulfate adenylyltransferase subunit 2
MTQVATSHLDALENEAIHILREAVSESRQAALLFSAGKDSVVVLHLVEKAFRPMRLPLSLLHIDTGHNFQEVIDFRDQTSVRLGEKVLVGHVQDSIDRGSVSDPGPTGSRNALQSVTLLEAVQEHGFDCLIGGARRDEEKARAKERIFSHRDEFGAWNPRRQRPEVWSLYNGRVRKGEHMRVFPISNWTELDVWSYIVRENLALPSIYFSHVRPCIKRSGKWLAVTHATPALAQEKVENVQVRYRTVGDMTCTCPVESAAENSAAILQETLIAKVSERGATRLDDQTSEAAMELRKKEGYF